MTLNKITPRVLDHLDSWGIFLKHRTQIDWTKNDEDLLEFIREYKRKIIHDIYTRRKEKCLHAKNVSE